jgi:hypothetical protein
MSANEVLALDVMQDFLDAGHTVSEAARLATIVTDIPATRLLSLTATTNG